MGDSFFKRKQKSERRDLGETAFYGRRSRKSCEAFVAGMVTDLLVPSSLTVASFGTQLAVAIGSAVSSNAKSAVSADGQETVTLVLDGSKESNGSSGR